MQLHTNKELFNELIEQTAEIIQLPSIYIEKDYWLTKSLQQLARSNLVNSVVFKGGTSLSKAHNIIKRFSEDIDLAIVDFALSDAKRKKQIKDIEKTLTQNLVYIKNDERNSKGSRFRKTVWQYPKDLNDDTFGHASPELLIELNSFSNPKKYESHSLQSYIADALIKFNKDDIIKKYNLDKFSINVLSVEQTLVEKFLIVVKDSYSADPIETLTKHIRHLYDICLVLKNNKFREFVSTNEFRSLCRECISSEVTGELDDATCLENPLKNAPLFSQIESWSRRLENTYNNRFKDLVYENLPPMKEIIESINFLKQNLI